MLDNGSLLTNKAESIILTLHFLLEVHSDAMRIWPLY